MHANARFYFQAERPRYWSGPDPNGPLHALPLWMLEDIGRLQRQREVHEKSPVGLISRMRSFLSRTARRAGCKDISLS